MNNTVIYLLRHGETEWNKVGRLQGQLASPLTEKGRMQAHKMGECLARELNGETSYSMVCSTLGRTRETAGIVCLALGFEYGRCTFDDLIMEISQGDWDGYTVDELEEKFPEGRAAYNLDKWHTVPPSGESNAMMEDRARQWFAALPESSDSPDSPDPLIVVSHGAMGRVLRGHYAGLSQDEMLSLNRPQDAIFKLSGGTIEEIPVEG